jgi:CPA2 family monovalent cation:H+ antiporter-2
VRTVGTLFVILIGIYLGGRRLERSLMKFIGGLKSNEIFVLTTLLTIMGAAWVSSLFNLPTMVGVFLAGMIIGETEFRHKVEDDLRPFHDIMIGIFFMVMGLTLKLPVLVLHLPLILKLLAGIVLIKMFITAMIVALYSRNAGSGLRVGFVLSNCDEFSLILVILAMESGIITSLTGNILLITIILSLMLSTILILYNKKMTFYLLSLLKLDRQEEKTDEPDNMTDLSGHIILCGYGETGKNIRNILKKTGIPLVAIDMDPQHVENAMAAGLRAIYGEAGNLKTLAAANIAKARALVVTFDHYTQAMKLVHKVRSEYPSLPVIVRVHEVSHVEDLLSLGATAAFSDGIGISLSMRQEIMRALKIPEALVVDEEELIRRAFKT